MVNESSGAAQLRARHPLNCEEEDSFVITIAAVSCSGALSNRSEDSF